MTYIAIASVTPSLRRCVTDAIHRTTPEPHDVLVDTGLDSHAQKLDRLLSTLPDDAEYVVTMDDDAAPLKPGWLSWLVDRLAGADAVSFGSSAVVGALYRVKVLRGRSFVAPGNPGSTLGIVTRTVPRLPARALPWWLQNTEAFADESGELVFAHLGGGTIGATSWRLPVALWPLMVRRYLRRHGGP